LSVGLLPYDHRLEYRERLPGYRQLFQQHVDHMPHGLELELRDRPVGRIAWEPIVAAKTSFDDRGYERVVDCRQYQAAHRLEVDKGQVARIVDPLQKLPMFGQFEPSRDYSYRPT
jgi:hypothetical protein